MNRAVSLDLFHTVGGDSQGSSGVQKPFPARVSSSNEIEKITAVPLVRFHLAVITTLLRALLGCSEISAINQRRRISVSFALESFDLAFLSDRACVTLHVELPL